MTDSFEKKNFKNNFLHLVDGSAWGEQKQLGKFSFTASYPMLSHSMMLDFVILT